MLTEIQAYCSAKHALVGRTKLGPAGVTAKSVAPGLCLTNPASTLQREGFSDDKQQTANGKDGISVGRLGTITDITDAACFFAFEAASWCTGQIIEVNGGR